jgi:hypothetical protein
MNPDTIVLIQWLLGDPTQLGELEALLRAAGLPRAHAGLPVSNASGEVILPHAARRAFR